jgi:hypothetical protein
VKKTQNDSSCCYTMTISENNTQPTRRSSDTLSSCTNPLFQFMQQKMAAESSQLSLLLTSTTTSKLVMSPTVLEKLVYPVVECGKRQSCHCMVVLMVQPPNCRVTPPLNCPSNSHCCWKPTPRRQLNQLEQYPLCGWRTTKVLTIEATGRQ